MHVAQVPATKVTRARAQLQAEEVIRAPAHIHHREAAIQDLA